MNTNKEYNDAIREYITNRQQDNESILDLGIIGERVNNATVILRNKPVYLQTPTCAMTLFGQELWLMEIENIPRMISLAPFCFDALKDGYTIHGFDKGFVPSYLTCSRNVTSIHQTYRYKVVEPIKPLTDDEIIEIIETNKTSELLVNITQAQPTPYIPTSIPKSVKYTGTGTDLTDYVSAPQTNIIKGKLEKRIDAHQIQINRSPVIIIHPVVFPLLICPYLPMIRPKRGSRILSELIAETMDTTPNAVEFSSHYNGIVADIEHGTIYSDSLGAEGLTRIAQKSNQSMNFLFTCQSKKATYRQAISAATNMLSIRPFQLPTIPITLPKMSVTEFFESAFTNVRAEFPHFERWVGYWILRDKQNYDPINVVELIDFLDTEAPKRTIIVMAILSSLVDYSGQL